ncbi:hypothetical protein K239x_36070 [Planctomycetes bacterium K23_9]|uniref:Uncharacterized protein n=1 Tax=Stieleria marina TaxID=1930275 RepID=A0A517NWU8_9BACT|nr:hypothetical protein K239x_36070 [Planctomycetes bacterium K23_9]
MRTVPQCRFNRIVRTVEVVVPVIPVGETRDAQKVPCPWPPPQSCDKRMLGFTRPDLICLNAKLDSISIISLETNISRALKLPRGNALQLGGKPTSIGCETCQNEHESLSTQPSNGRSHAAS